MLLRRLHLWISVPFGLIVSIICFSGASMVFEPEITRMLQRNVYYVEADGRQPLQREVLDSIVASELADDVDIVDVVVDRNPERTYQYRLSKPKKASIFVDQYTGSITGKSEKPIFFATMFRLHRWLLDSPSPNGGVSVGKLIVGITTIAFVIDLLLGIGVWLPSARRNLGKSVAIPLGRGVRPFMRGLHVGGGVFVALFLLAMALTGLTWSFDAYRDCFLQLFSLDASAQHGGLIYKIHTGSFGGMVSRVLWFVAALVGCTLPLTGYYLWIKRLVSKRRIHKEN